MSIKIRYHPVLLRRLNQFRSDAARRKFLSSLYCTNSEQSYLISKFHQFQLTGDDCLIP